jgi:hypothetical protein
MTTKEERAAIYARCRSLSPEEEDVTLEQQLNDCYSYCYDCAYTVGEQHVYCDLGEGDPMLAPQLSRLRQAAAHEQIDVLVTASADRIDELPAWQTVVIGELQKYNVRVESALERNGTHLVVEQIIRDTDNAVAQILQMREYASRSQHKKSKRKKDSDRK